MPAFSVPSHLALATSDARPESRPELRSPPHPPRVTISRALSAVLCIVTVVILLRRWRKRHSQDLTHQKIRDPSLPPYLHKTQEHHSLNPSSPPPQPAANAPTVPPPSSPTPPLPHPSVPSAFPAPTIRRRSHPLACPIPEHQTENQASPTTPGKTPPTTTTTTSSHTQLSPTGILRHDTLLAVSGCRRHVLVLGGASDDLARLVADAGAAGRGG